MTISIRELAVIASSAIVFAISIWHLGIAHTAVLALVLTAILGLLELVQRKRAREIANWNILSPCALEWVVVILGFVMTLLIDYLPVGVGFSRYDPERQMLASQILIVMFAAMTAILVYLSLLMRTQWNESRIEQVLPGFAKRTILFEDICRWQTVEWASVLRVDAFDGTRIDIPLYRQGAPELVEYLKRLWIEDILEDNEIADGEV